MIACPDAVKLKLRGLQMPPGVRDGAAVGGVVWQPAFQQPLAPDSLGYGKRTETLGERVAWGPQHLERGTQAVLHRFPSAAIEHVLPKKP